MIAYYGLTRGRLRFQSGTVDAVGVDSDGAILDSDNTGARHWRSMLAELRARVMAFDMLAAHGQPLISYAETFTDEQVNRSLRSQHSYAVPPLGPNVDAEISADEARRAKAVRRERRESWRSNYVRFAAAA